MERQYKSFDRLQNNSRFTENGLKFCSTKTLNIGGSFLHTIVTDPVALRDKCANWSLLENHNSTASLTAFIFVSKSQAQDLFPRVFWPFWEDPKGPGQQQPLGNLLPPDVHVSPWLNCLHPWG